MNLGELREAMERFRRCDYKDRKSRVIARICRALGITFLDLVQVRMMITTAWRRLKGGRP